MTWEGKGYLVPWINHSCCKCSWNLLEIHGKGHWAAGLWGSLLQSLECFLCLALLNWLNCLWLYTVFFLLRRQGPRVPLTAQTLDGLAHVRLALGGLNQEDHKFKASLKDKGVQDQPKLHRKTLFQKTNSNFSGIFSHTFSPKRWYLLLLLLSSLSSLLLLYFWDRVSYSTKYSIKFCM